MWGAMRFLHDSLVRRRRKILLEDILLLCIRCLLIMMLSLVAARPFVTPGSRVAWFIVLPLLTIALAMFAASFVLWRYQRLRYGLTTLSALLFILAAAALAFEERFQSGIFARRDARDMVLILDASDSMLLETDGVTNFHRAREEAAELVNSAPPGTAFSVVVGGSMPYAPLPRPLNDREAVLAVLHEVEPGRGLLRAPESFSLAAVALARGNNPGKEIYLFSDAQREGWRLDQGDGAWGAIRDALGKLPARPPVVMRRMATPDFIDSLAVTGISFCRRSIGLDRPVAIRVTVANHGSEIITSGDVRLTVEDAVYTRENPGRLPPGAKRDLTFEHQFTTAGAQVVTAEIVVGDDIAVDNIFQRIVTPVSRIRVLVVDGQPAAGGRESPSFFIRQALSPRGAGQMPPDDTAGAESDSGTKRSLVAPLVLAAEDIASSSELAPYALIILADVPRLPVAAATSLEEYVANGGNLLVAHGPGADAGFYNHWTVDGEWVMPGKLGKQYFVPANTGDAGEEQTGIDPAGLQHPGLGVFADHAMDITDVVMRRYWRLVALPEAAQEGKQPPPGATFGNGDPLLMENRLGAGRVLQLACSLDMRDSNFPATRGFVVFLHHLLYHLAATGVELLDVYSRPGARLDLAGLATSRNLEDRRGVIESLTGHELTSLAVTAGPSGRKVRGRLTPYGTGKMAAGMPDHLYFSIPAELAPGVHGVQIPEALQAPFDGLLDDQGQLPFALLREGNEGRVQPVLDHRDTGRLREYLLWREAGSMSELLRAMDGTRFGRELWRPLAFVAFFLLLGEIAASRWVARRRRTGSELKVDFAERTRPNESFYRQLEKMFNHFPERHE